MSRSIACSRLIAWVAPILLAGCAGTSSPAVTVPDPSAAISTNPGAVSESLVGHSQLVIDLASLTGRFDAVRSASSDGQLFHLGVNQFFAGNDPLSVTSVEITPTEILVGYEVRHPFPAPADIDGPATAANRLDLGIAGRMLFMVPAPAVTTTDPNDANYEGNYRFDHDNDGPANDLVTNAKLVTNADGYFDPGELIARNSNGQPLEFPEMNGATAWPYLVLVDELQDNRISSSSGDPITNNLSTQGSYDPLIGGWQLFNLGPGNDDWTGYGVLHQGQTAGNLVRFSVAELEGSELRMDVALIAKYIDPRTGSNATQLRSNRLPSDNVDDFHYRMPYGALDLEWARVTPPASIGDLSGSSADAGLAFADQDYSAVVGGGTFDDSLPINHIPADSQLESMHVASQELGFVATSTTVLGGSGRPEDPVTMTVGLQNVPGGTGGIDTGAWAAVRLIDQEDTSAAADIGVNIFSLNENKPPAPLVDQDSGHHPIVYQAFFVPIAP